MSHKLAHCPICGGAKLRKTPAGLITCSDCECSAPFSSWPKAGSAPYEVIAYITVTREGELKITKDKVIAATWKEVGLKIETITDKIKVKNA